MDEDQPLDHLHSALVFHHAAHALRARRLVFRAKFLPYMLHRKSFFYEFLVGPDAPPQAQARRTDLWARKLRNTLLFVATLFPFVVDLNADAYTAAAARSFVQAWRSGDAWRMLRGVSRLQCVDLVYESTWWS